MDDPNEYTRIIAVIAPIVKKLMHSYVCWNCSRITADPEYVRCECKKVINAEKNRKTKRSSNSILRAWVRFIGGERCFYYIFYHIAPTRENVLIINCICVTFPSTINDVARVREYYKTCNLFKECSHTTIDEYLKLLEHEYPSYISFHRFEGDVKEGDRHNQQKQIDATKEEWEMDVEDYTSYIQWLPREICDDVVAII